MTDRSPDTCPAEILEWIAWYPEALGDAQRGAVEAHAAVCAACREEIAVLAGRAEASVTPADPEQLFARVLALVEADGIESAPLAASRAPLSVHAPAPRLEAPVRRRRSVWMRSGVQIAASVGLAVLAGGLGGWVGRDWLGGEPVYTVAGETPLAAEGAVALDVVFRSDATAERIQTSLRGLGAELVSGPSPLGRYQVELPPGADASAAAALLRAEGTGVASFAEPLRP
ncbi:MAG: hypothetical protein OZ948_14870 [Deltaproteobacteria bacterium]|nr:hypothetical protein [Deltaproteobacteria bacterium]